MLPVRVLYQTVGKLRETQNYVIPIEIRTEDQPDIETIDVEWGTMNYHYSDRSWNPDILKYEDGEWTDNGTGYIRITNQGESDVQPLLTFDSLLPEIKGYFLNEKLEQIESEQISPAQTQTFSLKLEGKPERALAQEKIGSVKLTLR